MAFAVSNAARLSLSPPEGGKANDAAGFASRYGPFARSPKRAFDAGLRPDPFPDRAASLLPGLLAATRTGLTPAGDDEHERILDLHHGSPFFLAHLRVLIDKALANRGYVLLPLAAPHHRREGLVFGRPSTGQAASGPLPTAVEATTACPMSASPLGTVTAIEAIVRQDDRRPSNGATGGGRPLLLLDAGRPATTGRLRRNQVSSNGISM